MVVEGGGGGGGDRGGELQQAGVRGERSWSAWVFLFCDGEV